MRPLDFLIGIIFYGKLCIGLSAYEGSSLLFELKILRYVPDLLFRPAKLTNVAVDEAIQKYYEEYSPFAQPSKDKIPPEKINKISAFQIEQVKKLRLWIAKSLLWVAAVFFGAWLLAWISGGTLTQYVGQLQAVSAFLILWSIFGNVGRDIQTIDGDTLPEKINEVWFRLLTLLGIYLLVLSLFV